MYNNYRNFIATQIRKSKQNYFTKHFESISKILKTHGSMELKASYH